MKTVFLVGLGVLLGLFLFVYIAIWWVKRKLKGFLQEIGDAYKGLGEGFGSMPQYRVTLVDASDIPLHHPEQMATITNELAALGFEESGTYLDSGLKPPVIRGMANEAESIYAAIYDTAQQEPKLDLIRETQDGVYLMATTTEPQGLSQPPWRQIERAPGLGAGQLYDRLNQADVQGPYLPVSTDAFVTYFQDTYAKEIDWRIDRGGYTDEEIEQMIEASGGLPEDSEEPSGVDMMDMIRTAMKASLSSGLEEALLEAYLEQSGMSALEWEKIEDRVRFVHKVSDKQTLFGMLNELQVHEPIPDDEDDDDDDEQDESDEDSVYDRLLEQVDTALKTGDALAVFASLAEQQPRYGELKKLARLTEPALCDVYLFPGQPDD